ncbi:uncharacterized protein LOC143367209 [Andrena cerasifolii]|uniref:uncharacterized protein LOC143367209 n=1 Tax=Andrena cerasifolii TaxID=2819439 RepID=UPI00403760EA
MPNTKTTYRWKGKIVTEAVYNKRLAQQKVGRARKSVSTEPGESDQITSENVEEINVAGRRIVELNILGQQLWCTHCAQSLSLQYIEREVGRGLASQLLVRCPQVPPHEYSLTDAQESTTDKRRAHFDINSKVVLGVMHTGLGWTNMKKLLVCMNVPCPDFKTFKKYEQEVGLAAEAVAKKSCIKATALERKLTVEEAQNIENQL